MSTDHHYIANAHIFHIHIKTVRITNDCWWCVKVSLWFICGIFNVCGERWNSQCDLSLCQRNHLTVHERNHRTLTSSTFLCHILYVLMMWLLQVNGSMMLKQYIYTIHIVMIIAIIFHIINGFRHTNPDTQTHTCMCVCIYPSCVVVQLLCNTPTEYGKPICFNHQRCPNSTRHLVR